MVGALIPLAVLALVIFAVRRARREQSPLSTGQQVRFFFLYLSLLVAVLVAAAGLAGSIGPVVDGAALVADDSDQAALNLAMLLLGVPLAVVLGLSTRRRLASDRTELQSFGWSLFVTVGTVVPLVVAMVGGYRTLLAVVRAEDYDGFALAQLVVWGATWYGVRRTDRALTHAAPTALRHVTPALIGLGVSAVALGQLVSGLVQRAFDAGAGAVVVPGASSLHRGLALLAVGGAVWVLEWLRGLNREPGSEAWRFAVVLFGVAGGLITAITSTAIVGYQVVVWLVGSPSSDVARTHFRSMPDAVGGLCAGGLVWWYHRTTLKERPGGSRAEVDRTYEHLMAAGGLGATSFGVVILIVAIIEASTGARLLRGDSAINTLLLACTLLVVGVPVWFAYWRSTLRRRAAEERNSITRRVYLVTLLGVGGLVALGTAIGTVYVILRDMIDGRLDSSTLRAVRYPLAVLVTSGGVAGYHFAIFRGEHPGSSGDTSLESGARTGPHRVVVAGPSNPTLEATLRAVPGVELEWVVAGDGSWPVDDVVGRVSRIVRAGGDAAVVLTSSGVVVGRM
jgi:hypothetical protein